MRTNWRSTGEKSRPPSPVMTSKCWRPMDLTKTWKDRLQRERLLPSFLLWKRPKHGTTALPTARSVNTDLGERFTAACWWQEYDLRAKIKASSEPEAFVRYP